MANTLNLDVFSEAQLTGVRRQTQWTDGARNLQIPALAKVSPPARGACSVLAAMPSDAGTLSHLKRRNIRTQFMDDAGDFVSCYARIPNFGHWPSFVCTSLWHSRRPAL